MTSAYHPQSNGQSEVVNKIITMYLRCLTGDIPKEWIRWFPWAEVCYNIAYHKSIRTTLFKLVYGRDPPQLKTYSPGDAAIPSFDDLQRYAYKDRSFQVGDWVWLKLMARAAVGISKLQKGKLAPKYFGPFQISECIGSVAYHLNLP